MTSSKIDFIRPENLNDSRIFSWFTLKNPAIDTENSKIPGLNLGLNSKEEQSALLENLKLLSVEIRTHTHNLALANQVHKTEVKVVTKGGIFPGVDGFVSNTQRIALGIQVADCGAVLFGDSKNQVIGAAHVGWRGAVADIIPKTLEEMIKLGAEKEYIKVFVSPCLSLHNFEVGEEVAEQFDENLVDRNSYPKPHVNLKGLIKQRLLVSGIKEHHININEQCTKDHEDLFYSYRREKEKSGRMLGVVKLNSLK